MAYIYHEMFPDDLYSTGFWFLVDLDQGDVKMLLESEGDVKMLASNEGDVKMLLESENPGFWFLVDLDQEKKMRNVFWVDGKGRNDYRDFCDVVFIDTYYVGNKYNIPFVPIVGVNHHFQFMLLGCGLMGDESTSTFSWLMSTWVRAVGGQTPRVIMTETDKPLKEAFVDVFPDSRHCVLSKITEDLSPTMNRYENFLVTFQSCIYRSWTEDEFETEWCKMIEELRENEWIQSLYEDRKKWVPTYMRDIFLDGLSTPELSESISSFFDKYLTKNTTLEEFLDRYAALLHDRYEEEAKADRETHEEQPTLRSRSNFEKRMSTVYTSNI